MREEARSVEPARFPGFPGLAALPFLTQSGPQFAASLPYPFLEAKAALKAIQLNLELKDGCLL